ncbi:MAG: site-specific integrase [Bacteroidia bacterium]
MKSFSVTYLLRKLKSEEKDLKRKVYARITCDKIRADFSLNRTIEVSKWDEYSNKPKSIKDNGELIKYLATVEEMFYKIERKLMEESIPVTPSSLLNAYNELKSGKNKATRKTLFEVFDIHNEQMAELAKTGAIVKATVLRYITVKNYLKEFLIDKHQKVDVFVDELKLPFVLEFDLWLRTNKNCANNTVVKYVKNLKKIIKLCMDYGWLSIDPFHAYKGKTKIVARDFLDLDELKRLAALEIKIDRLDKTRKLFLFSCYTGLAYIDLISLMPGNIHTDNDAVKWIFKERKKTQIISRIFLIQEALEIISEYEKDPDIIRRGAVLPTLSNQKLNAYLKELADMAGIKKNLTFHVARHTFATTVTLANGISLESVSAQLGHTNLRQTQHYAKMVNSRISNEMKGLGSILG